MFGRLLVADFLTLGSIRVNPLILVVALVQEFLDLHAEGTPLGTNDFGHPALTT